MLILILHGASISTIDGKEYHDVESSLATFSMAYG